MLGSRKAQEQKYTIRHTEIERTLGEIQENLQHANQTLDTMYIELTNMDRRISQLETYKTKVTALFTVISTIVGTFAYAAVQHTDHFIKIFSG